MKNDDDGNDEETKEAILPGPEKKQHEEKEEREKKTADWKEASHTIVIHESEQYTPHIQRKIQPSPKCVKYDVNQTDFSA